MDANDVLEEKLRFYRDAFLRQASERLTTTIQPTGSDGQIDIQHVVQELDPALFRNDFDAGIHAIANDFATSFNDVLLKVEHGYPHARRLVGLYVMTGEAKLSFGQQLQRATTPVYQALGDLGGGRSAYLNFRSSHTQRSLVAGNVGGVVGGTIGMVFGPLGALVGGAIGGHLAGSGVDTQQEQLLQDYRVRLDALSTAADRACDAIVDGHLDPRRSDLRVVAEIGAAAKVATAAGPA